MDLKVWYILIIILNKNNLFLLLSMFNINKITGLNQTSDCCFLQDFLWVSLSKNSSISVLLFGIFVK